MEKYLITTVIALGLIIGMQIVAGWLIFRDWLRVGRSISSLLDAKTRREELELEERKRILDEEGILRRVNPTRKSTADDSKYQPR